jgi:hypothetical protein
MCINRPQADVPFPCSWIAFPAGNAVLLGFAGREERGMDPGGAFALRLREGTGHSLRGMRDQGREWRMTGGE